MLYSPELDKVKALMCPDLCQASNHCSTFTVGWLCEVASHHAYIASLLSPFSTKPADEILLATEHVAAVLNYILSVRVHCWHVPPCFYLVGIVHFLCVGVSKVTFGISPLHPYFNEGPKEGWERGWGCESDAPEVKASILIGFKYCHLLWPLYNH